MMRGNLWTSCVIVLLFFLSSAHFNNHQDNSSLEIQETQHSGELFDSQITFNQNNGDSFTDTLELNGTITNKQGNYSWKIVDLFNLDLNFAPIELISGHYLDSITPISEHIWEWSLNVNISQFNCTCSIIISSSNIDQEVIHSSELFLYLGSESHRPYILYNSLNGGKNDVFNYSISFEFILPDDQFTSIDAINDDILFLESKICQIRSNVCVDNWLPIVLNFSLTDNIVSININQNEQNIEDGYWMFEIYVKDNFLRTSNVISHILIIDDKPPQVMLSSASTIQESESFLVYAEVDDYFVGSPISLTWTITDPSGSSRGLSSEEFYHNSTIELTLNHSGTWDIHLLVRDSANHLVRENITIFVENIEPSIILDLDGLSVGQGDELMVTSDSSWMLNASGSYDSLNDVDNLIFEWFIDGVKLDSNSPILTNSDIIIDSSTEIRLIVYDDDQLSDNITFTISLSQAEDDSISVVVILLSGVSVSFISIIIIVKLFLRRDSNSFELPKWKSKN